MSETRKTIRDEAPQLLQAEVDACLAAYPHARHSRIMRKLLIERAALLTSHADLLAALKGLAVEVSGILGTVEPQLRDAAGNTNVAVLIQRWEEAKAQIARAEAPAR